MASLIALSQEREHGQARAVYDDRWRPIYEALGCLSVQRATEVEFDESSSEWVATHLAIGQIIGQGRNRSEVIAQEVAWLEAHDLGGSANQVTNHESKQTTNQNAHQERVFQHKENSIL